LWTVTPPKGQGTWVQQPTHPDELTWSQSRTDNFAVYLGRQIDTVHNVIRDTPQRIAEVDLMTAALVKRGRETGTVMHHALRTYLGIVVYMIQINAQLRSLTNILWRTMTAHTRLGQSIRDRPKWQQPDYPVPWGRHATEHILILNDGLKSQQGRAFAHEQDNRTKESNYIRKLIFFRY
jgi:hypothetical protein